MKKAPAFQFYTKDFIVDVQAWTNEEVGAYIRLLCYQWDNGSIPSDKSRLNLIVADPMFFDNIWTNISYKFLAKNGAFYNKRLEESRVSMIKYRKSAARAGRKGAKKRWGTLPKPYKGKVSSSSPSSPSIKTTKVVRGKPDINSCIEYLGEKVESIDGTVKSNRHACNNLLKKIKRDFPTVDAVESVKTLIDRGLTEDFHIKNMTNFNYIYKNMMKLKNISKKAEEEGVLPDSPLGNQAREIKARNLAK